MNEEKILQNCFKLFEEFNCINRNKHNIGYCESIRRIFNIVGGTVDINHYKIHTIEIKGNIDKYEINKNLDYETITEDFNDLSKELIFDYYLSEDGKQYNDIAEFSKILIDKMFV